MIFVSGPGQVRPEERHNMTTFRKIPDKRHARLLALLCAATYLGSYITRVNFAAVTVEIIRDMGWAKTDVAPVTTALFIAYGLGQFISGYLGDRIPPNRLMVMGLGTSVLLNLAIPLCSTVPQMTVIWAVNGLAQAMLWPPIVRILSGYCTPSDYEDATVIVSWGSSVGTMLVYLVAPLIISLWGWRAVFFVSSGGAALIVAAWLTFYPRIVRYAERCGTVSEAATPDADAARGEKGSSGENSANNAKAHHKSKIKLPKSLIFVLGMIMLSVICLGILRDSITSWLPSYISETFNYGSGSSILSGVIIPLVTTIIYPQVLAYYRRFFTNELVCAASIYLMSAAAALILFFVHSASPILAVLLLALICAGMHAANFVIIGLVPKRFERYDNVSFISGLINSFVYVGSSVSIWGIAAIAQGYGWQTTIAIWCVCAVAGGAFCLAAYRPWARIFAIRPKRETRENRARKG